MHQDGYDLSILRGRHYVKMGYARAWNYVTYRLKLEELPESGQLQTLPAAGVPRKSAKWMRSTTRPIALHRQRHPAHLPQSPSG